MAEAPRPGTTRRAEEAASAQLMCELVYDGQALTLALYNLPLIDKRACKVETGMSLGRHLDDIDDVSVCVLWWLARRRNGEPRLAYALAEDQFDGEKLTSIDFNAKPNGDDPEA